MTTPGPEPIENVLGNQEVTKAKARVFRSCLVILLLGAAGATWVWFARRRAIEVVPANLSTVSARLTFEKDDGGSLDSVDRMQKKELWLRVLLSGVPLGSRLRPSCVWIDPSGEVAKTNRWETHTIDHTPWETHCRQTFLADSPTGSWKVEMSVGERTVGIAPFEVR
jgi:hypothetical protein